MCSSLALSRPIERGIAGPASRRMGLWRSSPVICRYTANPPSIPATASVTFISCWRAQSVQSMSCLLAESKLHADYTPSRCQPRAQQDTNGAPVAPCAQRLSIMRRPPEAFCLLTRPIVRRSSGRMRRGNLLGDRHGQAEWSSAPNPACVMR